MRLLIVGTLFVHAIALAQSSDPNALLQQAMENENKAAAMRKDAAAIRATVSKVPCTFGTLEIKSDGSAAVTVILPAGAREGKPINLCGILFAPPSIDPTSASRAENLEGQAQMLEAHAAILRSEANVLRDAAKGEQLVRQGENTTYDTPGKKPASTHP
jgi:hypothetical protein